MVKATPLVVPASSGVSANDTDPSGLPLSAVLVANPTHGILALNSDGSFTYRPTRADLGNDSFTYQARDGPRLSTVTTVSLYVAGANDPPVSRDDSYFVANPTSITSNSLTVLAATGVLANNTDINGQTITALLVTGPSHGSLKLVSEGSFTYNPNAGFGWIDTFTYRAVDSGQLQGNLATVTIQVTSSPTANADAFSTPENTLLTATTPSVLANDTDPNGRPLRAVVTTVASFGSLTLDAHGSLTYLPHQDFVGTDPFPVLRHRRTFLQYHGYRRDHRHPRRQTNRGGQRLVHGR